MDPNWQLVAIIVIINDIIVSFLWIAFNGQRLYEVNRRNAEKVAKLNDDYLVQTSMMRQVTVAQVIGRTEEM